MTSRGLVDPQTLVATPGEAGSGVAGVVGYSRLAFGRIAQRESARFTRGRSLVRSQVRPSLHKRPCATLRRNRHTTLETSLETTGGLAGLPLVFRDDHERKKWRPRRVYLHGARAARPADGKLSRGESAGGRSGS